MDANASDQKYSLKPGTWYRVFRGIIGFILRLFCRLEIRGLEHVPDVGPYLLLVNHIHWLDAPTLMVVFPYRSYVFAAAKRENHWFFGPIFRSMDAIFVRRGEVDRRALRKALAVLEGGGVLGLAPEGTRSPTGALQKGRSGAAFMAYRSGAKLLPVVITGQKKVFPLWRGFRRAPLRAVFGPAFEPPPPSVEGRVSAADARAFTEEIMYRLAAMLPPEYRGEYADVVEERPDLVAFYAAMHEASR
jgi:1-acyl-sn-glycerol-3-phosphate acyltransferase